MIIIGILLIESVVFSFHKRRSIAAMLMHECAKLRSEWRVHTLLHAFVWHFHMPLLLYNHCEATILRWVRGNMLYLK